MNISTPEQSSKALQSAQRVLVEAQDDHRKSLEQLRRLRATFDQTNTGLVDPSSEAGQRTRERLAELRGKIQDAITQRDQAREALTAAKDQAAAAEREACKAVGDKHRPEYLKRLKVFIVAKLESIAPMVVAASEAVEIREACRVALGVRREHHARMIPALGLLEDQERFERIRQETVELIDAKVITAKDLPPKLSKAWNIT